jgi:hypothetical protein
MLPGLGTNTLFQVGIIIALNLYIMVLRLETWGIRHGGNLVKMKFSTWNFASDVFGRQIQFEKHFAKKFFGFRVILIGKIGL